MESFVPILVKWHICILNKKGLVKLTFGVNFFYILRAFLPISLHQQSVGIEKLQKTLSHEKAAPKMFVKLIPERYFFLNQISLSAFPLIKCCRDATSSFEPNLWRGKSLSWFVKSKSWIIYPNWHLLRHTIALFFKPGFAEPARRFFLFFTAGLSN